MRVYVTFDPAAVREDSVIELHNHTVLTPRAAIAARDVAAGLGASVHVSDGSGNCYRVVGNRARRVHEGGN